MAIALVLTDGRWRLHLLVCEQYPLQMTFPNVNQHVSTVVSLHRWLLARIPWNISSKGGIFATKIIVDGFLQSGPGDAVIVKFVKVAVFGCLEESIVVSGVQVAAMHQDAMQSVNVWLRTIGILGEVWGRIPGFWKLESVVDLHHDISLPVIFEPFELKVQNAWKTLKDDALFRVLHSMALGLVLVLTIHDLRVYVVFETFVDSGELADIQLDVPVVLDFARRVIDIDAGNVGLGLANEEPCKSMLCFGSLHLFFQSFHQNT
jgi:hypothetical protein